MLVCTSCGTGKLKTVRGQSRRSFFRICTNRRCRASYEIILSISGAISQLPKQQHRKRRESFPEEDAPWGAGIE